MVSGGRLAVRGVPCGQVAGIDFYFAPFQQFLASGLAGENVRAEAGLGAHRAAGRVGMHRGAVQGCRGWAGAAPPACRCAGCGPCPRGLRFSGES